MLKGNVSINIQAMIYTEIHGSNLNNVIFDNDQIWIKSIFREWWIQKLFKIIPKNKKFKARILSLNCLWLLTTL